MNKTAIIVSFILCLLALAYCSSSSLSEGLSGATQYTSPDGRYTATVTDDGLAIKNNYSNSVQLYSTSGSGTYTLANGNGYASINNGVLVVTDGNGSAVTYNTNNVNSIFYGPDGATAQIMQRENQNILVVTTSTGQTYTYTYDKQQASIDIYIGEMGGEATVAQSSDGHTYVKVTGPDGQTITYTDDPASFQYDTSLPTGITYAEIPKGSEDLYILKSEVVPPVCPACPPPIIVQSSHDDSKCQPCPACARCPEPNFDCKKVPNYSAMNKNLLPQPALSSFSSFGM